MCIRDRRALLGCGIAVEVAPRSRAHRVPAGGHDVAYHVRYALAKLADLLLSNGTENVGYEFRHFAAFAHRVNRNSERLQFLVCPNAFQKPATEPMQPLGDHDDGLTLGSEAAHL